MNLTALQYLNLFFHELSGNINECNLWVLYNELYNIWTICINQCFPDVQCMVLEYSAGVKESCKVQERLIDFLKECREFIIMVSASTLGLTFKKAPFDKVFIKPDIKAIYTNIEIFYLLWFWRKYPHKSVIYINI